MIWLPSELWVDTLKLLSRRNLVRRVQRTCRRFHSIAELYVPSVHIFENGNYFWYELGQYLEANKGNDQIVAESNNWIVRHFRPNHKESFYTAKHNAESSDEFKLRTLAQKFTLRHFPALLVPIKSFLIEYPFWDAFDADNELATFREYLALLHTLRPPRIFIDQDFQHKMPSEEMLSLPLLMDCPILSIFRLLDAPSDEMICRWLHHVPNLEKAILGKEINGQNGKLLKTFWQSRFEPPGFIEQCKQIFLDAKLPSDPRAYLLTSCSTNSSVPPLSFRLENLNTREVLQMGEVRVYGLQYYFLRRCHIEDCWTNMDVDFPKNQFDCFDRNANKLMRII